MNIEHVKRHAATLRAAEKFVAWLKEADGNDESDVASILWDVVAAAGFRSLGPATAMPGQRWLVMFDLEKDQAA